MKRTIFLALVVCGLLAHGEPLFAGDTHTTQKSLFILNWADYMDPELLEEFSKEYNVKVHQVFYESDDHRDEIMASTAGNGLDLIIVNGSLLKAYEKQGWLQEIDGNALKNLKHVDGGRIFRRDGRAYAIPYFWGTLGIAYRRDIVGKELTSWRDIFLPGQELQGKVMMLRQGRELVGAALKALGYSYNSSSAEELDKAENLLARQKPFVKDYNILKIDETSALVKGDIAVAMSFNGDANKLKEYCSDIQFALPREGTLIWVDHIAVLSQSPNKALALAFIDFLNEPAHAAKLAEFVNYATPNTAAENLLSPSFRSNPTIYPPESILAASEVEDQLPYKSIELRNVIINRIAQ